MLEELDAPATAAGDRRGLQFLQRFIDQQVEEARTMRTLLDLIAE